MITRRRVNIEALAKRLYARWKELAEAQGHQCLDWPTGLDREHLKDRVRESLRSGYLLPFPNDAWINEPTIQDALIEVFHRCAPHSEPQPGGLRPTRFTMTRDAYDEITQPEPPPVSPPRT